MEKEKFIKEYNAAIKKGLNKYDLAKILNVSERTIRNKCKQYNLDLAPLKKTKKQEISNENFIEIYKRIQNHGGTTKDVAEELGCSPENVRQRAKVNGLELLDTHGGSRKEKIKPDPIFEAPFSPREIMEKIRKQQEMFAKAESKSTKPGIGGFRSFGSSAYDENGSLKYPELRKQGWPRSIKKTIS